MGAGYLHSPAGLDSEAAARFKEFLAKASASGRLPVGMPIGSTSGTSGGSGGGVARINEELTPFVMNVNMHPKDPDSHYLEIREYDSQDFPTIICTWCKLSNCEHIMFAFNEGLDTYLYNMSSFEMPLDLKKGTWITLANKALTEDMSIVFIPEIYQFAGGTFVASPALIGDTVEPTRELGILCAGESRKQVLVLLVNWMRERMASESNRTLKCKSRTHGFPQERAVKEILKSEKVTTDKVVYWWNIMRHATCTPCMDPLKNMEDLIPDNPNMDELGRLRGFQGGRSSK